MKTPDADHPITMSRQPGSVRVLLAGTIVAETNAALRLVEATYPPVLYVPRADIRSDVYVPSTRTSHCPYKGDARYFDLVVGDVRRPDAVWSYESPYPAVSEIAGYVAFYPDRVDAIEVS